jgi:dTDP-4-dehydrorhamnose 3,5-epimerase-like enzyme
MVEKSRLKDILLDISPNSDIRGEVIKVMTVDKSGWPARDVLVASIEPGAVRGNHYHKEKEEIYVVIKGKVLTTLVDINTKERKEIKFDGKKRQILFIHPYVSHSVKNIGNETAWFIEVQNTDYNTKDDFKYEV